MLHIIGIAGSLRAKSFNTMLLRAAAASAPSGMEIQIEPIDAIPLYNEDIERSAFPPAVKHLKELIGAADGMLMVTPEYNHSVPGVLKNAVDWISRPPADIPRTLGGLPIAIVGTSPGGFGTVLAQAAWLPVVRTLGMQPWFGSRITLAHSNQAFSPDGELIDIQQARTLKEFLAGFAEFVARVRPAGKPRT